METKKVFIAVPTGDTVHYKVVGLLCQLLSIYKDRYVMHTYVSRKRGIGEHRNLIVKEFLATDSDYLLMIDSDNPCPNNVLDLIELDKEVIALPTPINLNWGGVDNLYWNVFNENNQPIKADGEGLEKVHSAGTGVILIRRDVLEKVKHPFTTVRDKEDERMVGTDIAFCERCAKAGIDIHVHWGYKCRHYKEVDLLSLKSRIL